MRTTIDPPNCELLLRDIDRKNSRMPCMLERLSSALRLINCGLALPGGPKNARTA